MPRHRDAKRNRQLHNVMRRGTSILRGCIEQAEGHLARQGK
jgi:hypothetical protein